jgi:hypothetical protein
LKKKEIFFLLLLSCILAAIPFLVVKFPPLTDLPQHVAQVRLFADALSNPASPYRIQWITPYSLVYAVLGGSWLIFGPENAGRLGMLIIVIFWIVMLHLLAYKMKRPILAASLASILFFGHILYWGFFQFAFGWPLFIGWILLTKIGFRSRWKEGLTFFLAFIVLYMAHIFWFLLAIGWLVARHFVLKGDLKKLIIRIAAAAPLLLLGIAWYPSLAAYGFRSQTIWATIPFERLSPVWLVDASFGGVRGSMEYVFFALLAGWVLLACLRNRQALLSKMDRELLLLSALLFLLALVLPDKQTNTIRFCQRWVPPAFAFLLLSLPEPRIRKNILTAIVLAIVTAFFALTSLTWIAFESSEMSGLKESLATLPEAPRVLGLSYIKESPIVKGRPFIQVFAYSQVLRGGELNFSFADFGPSLVVYRQPRKTPWTQGLEWFPEKARKSDFQFFDYSLINADENLHAALSSESLITLITRAGRWRLYKVAR